MKYAPQAPLASHSRTLRKSMRKGKNRSLMEPQWEVIGTSHCATYLLLSLGIGPLYLRRVSPTGDANFDIWSIRSLENPQSPGRGILPSIQAQALDVEFVLGRNGDRFGVLIRGLWFEPEFQSLLKMMGAASRPAKFYSKSSGWIIRISTRQIILSQSVLRIGKS